MSGPLPISIMSSSSMELWGDIGERESPNRESARLKREGECCGMVGAAVEDRNGPESARLEREGECCGRVGAAVDDRKGICWGGITSSS